MDAGTKVEIMERGEWVGPFTVTTQPGRTPEHLVLSGPSGLFEHYADEFNTRPVQDPPAKDEFGPWEAGRYEDKDRGYLVVRKLKSNPGITRFHRASTGAPIWYTKDGATRKAAALNA